MDVKYKNRNNDKKANWEPRIDVSIILITNQNAYCPLTMPQGKYFSLKHSTDEEGKLKEAFFCLV